jgi:hypothetical protein
VTRTGAVLRAAAPLGLWAVHFIAVYAVLSAACAPRGLIPETSLPAVIALLTAVLAIATLALLILAGRGVRRSEDRSMERAAWWSALISLLAILANAWPVAFLPGCT